MTFLKKWAAVLVNVFAAFLNFLAVGKILVKHEEYFYFMALVLLPFCTFIATVGLLTRLCEDEKCITTRN